MMTQLKDRIQTSIHNRFITAAIPLFLLTIVTCTPAQADNYTSPVDAANAPDTIEEQLPVTPPTFKRESPTTIPTPPPAQTNPYPSNPAQSTQNPTTFNNSQTQTTPPPPQQPSTDKTQPSTRSDTPNEGDTLHDPNPEADDVGVTPTQPS